MKSFSHHSTQLKVCLALLAVVLVALLAWPHGTGGIVQAMQAPPPPQTPLNSSSTTSGPFTCTILYIYAGPNAFWFQCTQPIPGTVIYSYGASTDAVASASTSRMMALVTTAYSLGKTVNVFYTADNAFNPTGCIASTCRRLDGLYITAP